MAHSPRMTVVQALVGLHRDHRYSNIVLDELLKTAVLSPVDRAFASHLFYGVLERQITLDFVLERFSSTKLRKLHPLVLETLRVALYQILYMDRIPDAAAVNEAVDGIRRFKQHKAAGFVNGVLRSILRERDTLFDRLPTGLAGVSVRTSCPMPLLEFWSNAYGEDVAVKLAEAQNEVPEAYIRINTAVTTDDAFCKRLDEVGIAYTSEDVPHCLRLSADDLGNKLATVAENCYYYQDKASQYACLAFDARPDDVVADVCAAPGGKSFTAAQGMHNRGRLLSCDIYPHKCEVLDRRAAELGLSVIETAVRDASAPVAEPLKGAFDKVWCDVPCSGLGVIRRKPEIRYKDLAEFEELPSLQYTILERSAEMVRVGGVLQYSTCTLNPAENEQVVARFLAEHPEFEPRVLPLDGCFETAGIAPSHQLTLWPHLHHTDGFFIAAFTKKEGR